MANNGRGENEIKKETVGWVSQPTDSACGVDNKNISGSLKEENQSAVTERIDDKNISGSLNNNNETQSTPNGVAVGKNAHPIMDTFLVSGSLKKNIVYIAKPLLYQIVRKPL